MKKELVERIQGNGRLASELKRSKGYEQVLKKSAEKKEALLKEVLSLKELSEIRHRAGFIEGLNFMENIVDQWSQRAKTIK